MQLIIFVFSGFLGSYKTYLAHAKVEFKVKDRKQSHAAAWFPHAAAWFPHAAACAKMPNPIYFPESNMPRHAFFMPRHATPGQNRQFASCRSMPHSCCGMPPNSEKINIRTYLFVLHLKLCFFSPKTLISSQYQIILKPLIHHSRNLKSHLS